MNNIITYFRFFIVSARKATKQDNNDSLSIEILPHILLLEYISRL